MEAFDKIVGGLMLAFACYICAGIALHAIAFAIGWFCNAIAGLVWPFALLASWLWPAMAAIIGADAWRGLRVLWQGNKTEEPRAVVPRKV